MFELYFVAGSSLKVVPPESATRKNLKSRAKTAFHHSSNLLFLAPHRDPAHHRERRPLSPPVPAACRSSPLLRETAPEIRGKGCNFSKAGVAPRRVVFYRVKNGLHATAEKHARGEHVCPKRHPPADFWYATKCTSPGKRAPPLVTAQGFVMIRFPGAAST